MEAKPSTINWSGRGRVDVLAFGESPGREEAKKGNAFVGPAGKRIRDVIEHEIPDKLVVLDNVCPKYLDGGKPNAKLLRKFEDYRNERIKQCKPKVILLLGEHAIKAFGFKGRPTAVSSEIRKLPNGQTFVLSIHPAYTLRNPPKIWMFQAVFRSVKICLKPKQAVKFTELRDLRQLQAFLRESRDKLTALDLETSSLDPKTGQVLTAALSYDDKYPTTILVPLFHPEGPGCNKAAKMWEAIRDWWTQGWRVVHNAGFELKWLPPTTQLHDTLLQAWVLDENTPNNLNYQVQHVLKRPAYWLDLPEDKTSGYGEVPLDVLGPYNAADAYYTLQLYKHQLEQMNIQQRGLCDGLFVPLVSVLLRMEQNGIYIDRDKLEKVIAGIKRKARAKEREAERTFPGVNFRSNKQMQDLLFKQLKLPVIRKSKLTKKPSADEKTLEELSKQEPRLKCLAEGRKLKSRVSRLEGWLPWIRRNRMHTHFRLGTVVTARLATADPNLLNVDRGGEQRKAMISRFKGGKILQLDFAQHELRCQAATAGDKKLLEAFEQGRDPHQETADDISGRGTAIDRQTAKNVNFSVIYDITPYGLQEKYDIPRSLGSKLIRLWYQEHPWVKAYHRDLDRSLDRNGWVESPFGWRRRFEGRITDKIRRMGYNAPIQNMAVLICYLAMINVDHYLRSNRMKSILILQVHDSLVIDAHPREISRLKRDLPPIMVLDDYKVFCRGLKADIPLAVDIKIGDTFEECS